MARLARVMAVDTAYHVTQRGNARQFILEAEAIRTCTHTGRPLGAPEFIESLEQTVGRRLAPPREAVVQKSRTSMQNKGA